MKIVKGEYVVVASGKKKVLARVIYSENDTIKAVVSNRSEANKDTQEVVEVPTSEVLCNLGKNPERGSAYGVSVEPFKNHFLSKYWGEVFVFRDLTDSEKDFFISKMDKLGSFVKSKRLDGNLPIVIELRPAKGSVAGSYRYSASDSVSDTMVLKPLSWEDLKSVVLHELGHNIWYRSLTQKQKSRWVKKYKACSEIKTITPLEIKNARGLFSSDTPLKETLKEIDEKESLVVSACFDYIYDKFKLNSTHLSILLEAGDDLKSIWPKDPLDFGNLNVVVSDYAMKSPEELWAESFMFYLSDQKLPKSIQKLMKKTLSKVY